MSAIKYKKDIEKARMEILESRKNGWKTRHRFFIW
jgi:hypothetical protein